MKKVPKAADVVAGKRVRLRRKEFGMSQTALAGRLGVSFQQVQKYENGINRMGASRLLEIATVLAVPVSYFFPTMKTESNEGLEEHTLDLLNMPGAMDLLNDFARIRDRAARLSIQTLAKSLAGGQLRKSARPRARRLPPKKRADDLP